MLKVFKYTFNDFIRSWWNIVYTGFFLLLAMSLLFLNADLGKGIAGLMNMIMLPMWLGGGAFFSNQRFPDVVQPLVKALPLTWVTDGLRDAMLGSSGEGFAAPVACLLLVGFGAVTCLVSFRIFRWT